MTHRFIFVTTLLSGPLFVCASVESDAALQRYQELLQIIQNESERLEKCMQELLATNEGIADKLSKLSAMECASAFHTSTCNTDPSWVKYAKVTSPHLDIVKRNTAYYVIDKDETFYEISFGDHNLWVGADGKLWGYNQAGRIFCKEKTGELSLINSCSCNHARRAYE